MKREEAKREQKIQSFLEDVKQGDIVAVVEQLEQDEELLAAKDTLGLNPLHIAALKGDAFLVECLLYFDPLFTKKDIFGRTPLQLARSLDHREVVALLEMKQQGVYSAFWQFGEGLVGGGKQRVG